MSSFESTLFDFEAKEAFRLIFEQFNGTKDFTFTSIGTHYDLVFYSIQEDGSILAYVPSIHDIKKETIDEFLKKYNLSSLTFGATPWEVNFLGGSAIPISKNFSIFWSLFSVILLLAGISYYLKSLGEHKKNLLRKVSFLNQIVHEIKTPLTGLKLHLQLIISGIGTKENYLALDASIERLNRLFDDIVLINRPSEEVNLLMIEADQVDQILNELKNEFPNISIDSNFKGKILAEETRLRIILRNLAKNAIRYGKHAYFSFKMDDQFIFIMVKDDGPGVLIHENEKIFEEFYRSSEAKKNYPDGLGLGLFLVRRIGLEMGATIHLTNAGETGACFELKIPRSRN